MKPIKKALFSLLLSVSLLSSGCGTFTPDSIIQDNYNNYVSNSSGKDAHYEMDAALKEFICDMAENPPTGWQDVKNRKDAYLEKIKTQNISSNYPVLIKKEERAIVQKFLKDLITYGELESKEAGSNEIIAFFATMIQRFIVEVDDYEYKLEGV